MSKNLSIVAAAVLLVLVGVVGACGAEETSAGDASRADGGGAVEGGGGGSDGGAIVEGGNLVDGATADVGSPAAPFAVNLGTAAGFVILAKSGISTVPSSAITGNLGVSPIMASAITGFPLTQDATNVFATTPQVTGKVYAADYAPPTPSNLTTAVGDMETAFTDAASRAPKVTELGAGNIGGMTLTAGVYKWGTGLLIPANITLTGSATDVWVFQIAQDLTVSNGTNVVLQGGASAKNIFWQVSGAADLGTTSHFEGILLSQTAIALHTGATLNGRLLAQTAVTLDGNTVVQP
jgi:hypothetical protein